MPAVQVQFGLAGKEVWRRLDPVRAGAANRAGLIPVRPELVAAVRFFGATAPAGYATACCSLSAEDGKVMAADG